MTTLPFIPHGNGPVLDGAPTKYSIGLTPFVIGAGLGWWSPLIWLSGLVYLALYFGSYRSALYRGQLQRAASAGTALRVTGWLNFVAFLVSAFIAIAIMSQFFVLWLFSAGSNSY